MNDYLLAEVKQWLRDEIKHNEPIVSGEEELSDSTQDIHVGRMECAESLLKFIEGR
tara:strand:- start:645 stop:812 length:168 start_codon:yes stop_codon:yes gene_type:complete